MPFTANTGAVSADGAVGDSLMKSPRILPMFTGKDAKSL